MGIGKNECEDDDNACNDGNMINISPSCTVKVRYRSSYLTKDNQL